MLSQSSHVAMSVTNADFNPLDRRLYALSADFLLMDVRWGAGAFVETKEEAI